ncbi:MAG: DUF4062 domain-containing protein [Gammaproteobacteria bacterium]|nr:DUF4062 domain-containing protein [Gammaproteobacteria bacterium]
MQRLKVCLAEVKRSRPFFVALLGDRYGWIPPAERIQAATREARFQGQVAGLSVTELEIDYGTLMAMVTSPDREGQIWGHCLTAPPGASKSAVFAEICTGLLAVSPLISTLSLLLEQPHEIRNNRGAEPAQTSDQPGGGVEDPPGSRPEYCRGGNGGHRRSLRFR